MDEHNYNDAMNTLTEWAKKEGFKRVVVGDFINSEITWGGESLNTPMEIKIEKKYSLELQIYALLHELGHHQLRKDWTLFELRLPISAHAELVHLQERSGRLKRGIGYNVSCMEEEFKAWEEGYKLGKGLGISIDDKAWYKFKSKCLIGYMRYYSTKK